MLDIGVISRQHRRCFRASVPSVLRNMLCEKVTRHSKCLRGHIMSSTGRCRACLIKIWFPQLCMKCVHLLKEGRWTQSPRVLCGPPPQFPVLLFPWVYIHKKHLHNEYRIQRNNIPLQLLASSSHEGTETFLCGWKWSSGGYRWLQVDSLFNPKNVELNASFENVVADLMFVDWSQFNWTNAREGWGYQVIAAISSRHQDADVWDLKSGSRYRCSCKGRFSSPMYCQRWVWTRGLLEE